ncbi:MAG: sulfurtransferase TusA family protein [Immundisolibacteraceae bacterium]|nr:sulfurtransferase TusA family protein [Immundisolibacteraceae bacterium]
MNFDQQVDASGLLCPLPLLKSKRRLNQMESGQVLKLIATDSNAESDLRKFCDQSGHLLIQVDQLGEQQIIYLQKK